MKHKHKLRVKVPQAYASLLPANLCLYTFLKNSCSLVVLGVCDKCLVSIKTFNVVNDIIPKIFTLGEWYSCRALASVANSGVSTLGFMLLNASFRAKIWTN